MIEKRKNCENKSKTLSNLIQLNKLHNLKNKQKKKNNPFWHFGLSNNKARVTTRNVKRDFWNTRIRSVYAIAFQSIVNKKKKKCRFSPIYWTNACKKNISWKMLKINWKIMKTKLNFNWNHSLWNWANTILFTDTLNTVAQWQMRCYYNRTK